MSNNQDSMDPLDRDVHYGTQDRDFDVEEIQRKLLPEKVHELRLKLYHKAKAERKFRFYTLYDRVYRKDVLKAALDHVGREEKAAGVDGLTISKVLERKDGLKEFVDDLHEELRNKSYHPKPVKRVYIDKADGKKRPLGIPTLKDRVVQMAVLLILEPIFEADFKGCSYGFRPKRKAHDALDSIKESIEGGRFSVYDADLQGYFDTIDHGKLMCCIRMRVTDKSVLGLIRSWLKAPVVEYKDDKPQPPRKNDKGTPQGGVISPLLANLYLHWFDVMFHRQDGPYYWANARLVRYADDFVILARYHGVQIDEWIRSHIEDWLSLKINREKTSVVNLLNGECLDFLGFSFRIDRDQYGRDRKYLNLFPSKKSLSKARATIREKTGPKMCFKPTQSVVSDLSRYLAGWKGYFNYGYPRKALKEIGHFTRGRMIKHMNRRSQRKYAKPKGISHYQHLKDLGLIQL